MVQHSDHSSEQTRNGQMNRKSGGCGGHVVGSALLQTDDATINGDSFARYRGEKHRKFVYMLFFLAMVRLFCSVELCVQLTRVMA